MLVSLSHWGGSHVVISSFVSSPNLSNLAVTRVRRQHFTPATGVHLQPHSCWFVDIFALLLVVVMWVDRRLVQAKLMLDT